MHSVNSSTPLLVSERCKYCVLVRLLMRLAVVCVLLCLSATMQAGGFGNAVEKAFRWLERSDADPEYVRDAPRPFVVGLSASTLMSNYYISTENSSLNLSGENINKLGVTVGYRGLSGTYSTQIGTHGSGTSSSELSFTTFGQQYGLSFFTLRERSFLVKPGDVDDAEEVRTSAIKSRNYSINGYFVFNHKRFSYPAAFAQCYHQLKRCGSPLITLSVYHSEATIDTLQLVRDLGQPLKESIFGHMNHTSLIIGGGYAYNFVWHQNWTAHISATPLISVYSQARLSKGGKQIEVDNNTQMNLLMRAAVVWNDDLHYFGVTSESYIRRMTPKPMGMTTTSTYLRLVLGIRF